MFSSMAVEEKTWYPYRLSGNYTQALYLCMSPDQIFRARPADSGQRGARKKFGVWAMGMGGSLAQLAPPLGRVASEFRNFRIPRLMMPSSVICLLTEEWRRARRHTEVSALPCVSFLPVYLLKSDMLLRASLQMPSIQWEDGRNCTESKSG